MNQYKTCSKCHQSLLLDCFGKDNHAKSGLKSSCKPCRNQIAKDDYQVRRDYFRRYSREHREQLSMNSKAWYQKNKARKFVTERIRVSKNPEQNRDRLKKHRAENPEMYRNYSGKRRALLLSARQFEVKVSELRKIMSQDCFYCGSQAEHLDHVIPLSRGGLHKI